MNSLMAQSCAMRNLCCIVLIAQMTVLSGQLTKTSCIVNSSFSRHIMELAYELCYLCIYSLCISSVAIRSALQYVNVKLSIHCLDLICIRYLNLILFGLQNKSFKYI